MNSMIKNFKVMAMALACASLLLTGCGASNTAKGTAIGVGGGAAVGAGIGKKMDKQKKELEKVLPDDTKVEVVEEEGRAPALRVTFDSGILFATNSSTVSAASKSALRDLARNLEKNPDTDLRIVGHTDNTGRVDYNQSLSERRARSVYDYLLDQGVSSRRMVYEGKGIHQPVASNNTAEGRAQNRRVEVLISANEKMVNDAKREAGER